MVRVSEEHMPLSVFLVRLCGIIGGIFSTSGNFHTIQSKYKSKSITVNVFIV